ncbi:MAG: anaerobic ribonucleoside-triphosphate reductase [Euryarchaeota archaeon]|nr:anaerobic ribonucleoside-triphosphate reductase [Euryarchaeota archaeon]
MPAAKRAVRVVKSSGDTENFDPNVITTECVEAGIEFWTAAEVALEVARGIKDGISTKELQHETLEVLARKSPEAADRYRQFHSMKVRTSQNTIEAFDRKKITASILEETRIPEEVAKNVAREAEDELRRLKLRFISGPLIREIVNVKLLEHGLEEARADYTRLGMPVYDATRLIEMGARGETGPYPNPEAVHGLMADTIFREYALLKVLPLDLADAHMRGDIHIHGLDYFPTRPYCAHHDLRWFLKTGLKVDGTGKTTAVAGPARKAQVAVLHAAKALAAARTNLFGPQGMDFFNVWLAPYIRGMDYAEVRQVAQMFIYETGHMYAGGRILPSDINIEYGCPELLAGVPAVLPGGEVKDRTTYGDFEEEARDLARALTEVYLEGDHAGKGFPFPRPSYKLRGEYRGRDGYDEFMVTVHETAARFGTPNFINLEATPGGNVSGLGEGIMFHADTEDLEDLKAGTLRSGCLQAVTINLPRIAYQAGGREDRFYQLLDERMEGAKGVIDTKRDIIRGRLDGGHLPFLGQEAEGERYFRVNRAFQLIGYVGLNETARAFTGHELHEEPAARRFAREVVAHMADTLKTWRDETGLRWVLGQTPDGATARRLAKLDYGLFASSAVVQGDRETGDVHYTGCAHVRDGAPAGLMQRLEIEGEFHPMHSGGMITLVPVEEERRRPEDLLDLTRDITEKTGVGYWAYRPGGAGCG